MEALVVILLSQVYSNISHYAMKAHTLAALSEIGSEIGANLVFWLVHIFYGIFLAN